MVKYAAIWDNKLLTRDRKVIVGTKEEWHLFEGSAFTLIEVTVDIIGQTEIEILFTPHDPTPYPKLMNFLDGSLLGCQQIIKEGDPIKYSITHHDAMACRTEIYVLERYTDSDYYYVLKDIVDDETTTA